MKSSSPTRWRLGAVVIAAACGTAARGDVVIERCMVSLGETGEAKVAAREAGVIAELKVRKGMMVEADADLALLDSDQPRMELRKAEAELAQAEAKAASDVDVEYARAAHEKAKADLESLEQANKRREKTVSAAEVRAHALEVEKTRLQIEQAELEKDNNALVAKVKQVEVDAAAHAVDRRRIPSPLAGKVLDVFKHKGEWMQPGDVLAHVIRTDTVQVEGYVEKPREKGIDEDVPVTVSLATAGGTAEFPGRITYVKEQEQSGEYRVYAEVANRKEGDDWILQLGQEVTMKVHVGASASSGK